MLDMVYNHSLTSSLVVIAPEYSNGQYDGDKMNCGNPMMIEYFRQATIYLFRTYYTQVSGNPKNRLPKREIGILLTE